MANAVPGSPGAERVKPGIEARDRDQAEGHRGVKPVPAPAGKEQAAQGGRGSQDKGEQAEGMAAQGDKVGPGEALLPHQEERKRQKGRDAMSQGTFRQRAPE